MVKSAYIHIPFCKVKCKYCSFISFVEGNTSEYVELLLNDIQMNYKGDSLKTLYFGGGTPSLLSISNLKKIIKCFDLAKDCEITLEANPDDIKTDYLQGLKEIGITRISIGSQTFNDKILKIIGRRHVAKDTIKVVEMAQKNGFSNISIDLIYGLPNQTMNILMEDIKIATELGVQHISTYGLKIDKNSYFDIHKPENVANDDVQADMYMLICEKLVESGYEHYEISNFAKQGFSSKHNLNYWNNGEYYGFGIAAHGYVDGIRYSKYETLNEYRHFPSACKEMHLVTQQEKLEEELFLGFRRKTGIDTSMIFNKYGVNFDEKYAEVIKKFCPIYLEKTDSGYKLTKQGVLISNLILSEFIVCE